MMELKDPLYDIRRTHLEVVIEYDEPSEFATEIEPLLRIAGGHGCDNVIINYLRGKACLYFPRGSGRNSLSKLVEKLKVAGISKWNIPVMEIKAK